MRLHLDPCARSTFGEKHAITFHPTSVLHEWTNEEAAFAMSEMLNLA